MSGGGSAGVRDVRGRLRVVGPALGPSPRPTGGIPVGLGAKRPGNGDLVSRRRLRRERAGERREDFFVATLASSLAKRKAGQEKRAPPGERRRDRQSPRETIL